MKKSNVKVSTHKAKRAVKNKRRIARNKLNRGGKLQSSIILGS